MNDNDALDLIKKLEQYSSYAAFVAASEWISVQSNPRIGTDGFNRDEFIAKLSDSIKEMF